MSAANNWVKMDKNLANGVKVLRIAELTGLDPDLIVGRVHRFWSWVDTHVGEGGRLRIKTFALLSRLLNIEDDFWRALCDAQVCWLGVDDDGLFVPNWDKWFGEPAHKRAMNTKRQAKLRKKKEDNAAVAPSSRSGRAPVAPKARPDKTRLEETRLDQTRLSDTNSLRSSASSVVPTAAESRHRQTNGADDQKNLGAAADEQGQAADEQGQGAGERGQAGTGPSAEEIAANGGAGSLAWVAEIDWSVVYDDASSIARQLRLKSKTTSEADRSLILKAAACKQRFGENWLWDSVSGTVAIYEKPSKPAKPICAYLHAILAKRTLADFGLVLNAVLAQIAVPPEILRPPQAHESTVPPALSAVG